MTRALLLVGMFCASTACQRNLSEHPPITKIALGSCSHQNDADQMWREIITEEPDLFVWVGDNIYGDSHHMSVIKKKYDQQKSHPDYQKLLASTPIIGSWDDHDYGINDGGKNFSKKDESKELLLDFLDVPADHPVRSRKGVFQSYDYGEAEEQIKVILLDGRYFRDTLFSDTLTSAKFLPNLEGDMLGKQQWSWLEEELKGSKAKVNIIVSGIQVISSEHNFEKWSNFPKARQRLFDLLVKTQPNKTFFISGDRHMAELSKIDLDGLDYPVYDLTASGLTHTWDELWEEENQYRMGEIIAKKNYGLIHIDWSDNGNPQVSVEVKGHDGESFLREVLY